ncbi:MAG: hypothetical protein OXB92_11760 [Acidimicrobiaceae bacterium]|nr:hypothetical protein [Acidimicrobiaceae bacterium]
MVDVAEQFMAADSTRVTCGLTEVELRRNLTRLLNNEDCNRRENLVSLIP